MTEDRAAAGILQLMHITLGRMLCHDDIQTNKEAYC